MHCIDYLKELEEREGGEVEEESDRRIFLTRQ